jgi:AbrB family looped-hinge helix DNA binding protein
MDITRSTVTSKGQLVIPADLRRKHGIHAGTKVAIFEDSLGRIVLQPITEEYINRLRGCLASPDSNLLESWEKEHRLEGEKDRF